jgi:hypothetical protein
MLSKNGDNHRRVLGALRFMNRYRICQYHFIQISEILGDLPPVKGDGNFLSFKINFGDPANVTIKDFFVIVVLNLHHLVTDSEIPPASRQHLFRGIKCLL